MKENQKFSIVHNVTIMASNMKVLDWIAIILLIVGGLNWGLVGAFDFNLVTFLFGSIAWLVKTVYILVGLSGVYSIYSLYKLSN